MVNRIKKLVEMEVPTPFTLKEMRKELLGWSQRELAAELKKDKDLADVSQSYISKIERIKIGSDKDDKGNTEKKEGPGYSVSYNTFLRLFQFLQKKLRENAKVGTAGALCLVKRTPATVSPDDSLSLAIEKMEEGFFSQLPVQDPDENQIGRVAESDVLRLYERIMAGEERRPLERLKVRDVMRPKPFPRVRENESIVEVVHFLETNEAVLVKKDMKTTGIITRADIMIHLKKKGREDIDA